MGKICEVVRTCAHLSGLCAVLAGVLGCGDDEGGGSSSACGTAACGGDITGSWSVSAVCDMSELTEGLSIEGCPSASADASGIRMTGDVVYEQSGTYTADLTMSGSISVRYPAECLNVDGVQITCQQLDMALQEIFAEEPNETIESMSCSGGSSCTCVARMRSQDLSEAGTYEVSGNNVAMTGADGATSSNEYCVDESTLILSAEPEEVNGDMVGMGMVLVRQ